MDNFYTLLNDIVGKVFNDIQKTSADYQVKVNCPKCARLFNDYEPDNKYNLEINYNKRVYHCWKCGIKGRLRNLFKYYGNNEIYQFYIDNIELDFIDTSGQQLEDFSSELFEVKLPKEFISFRDYNEFDNNFIEPYNYLTLTRNLDLETIQKYNIGFALNGKYKNKLIIPFYDNNNTLNYYITRSYRDGTYKNPMLNKEVILNEHLIDWSCKIYLVEGFFDYLAIPFNTVILNGKIINNVLYQKLKKYKPPVCIALDKDASKDILYICNLLENIGIKDITYVYFNKDTDIDEIRRELTKDEYVNYLKNNIKTLNDEERLYNFDIKRVKGLPKKN